MDTIRLLEQLSSLSRKIETAEVSLDEWKWKRAELMSKLSDEGVTRREIAAAAGCHQSLVQRHITVFRSGSGTEPRPAWGDAWDTAIGEDERSRLAGIRTGKTLATAPMEQVERIIDKLPPERRKQVAAAAGHSYLKARVEDEEREARLTPRETAERQAAVESMTAPVRKAAGGFLTLGIVGHIEQATDELAELVADSSVTADSVKAIDVALEAFVTELEVARAMAGLEVREEA